MFAILYIDSLDFVEDNELFQGPPLDSEGARRHFIAP